MGNYKGRDNVRKRASRNKKTERLADAKANANQPVKQPASTEAAPVAG